MSWITSLYSFISKSIADLSGSYRERKRIATEMEASIATAEGNDADYDLQVLRTGENR